MTTTKRRARRIAADEAHSWARNLRLNNPHGKLVLSMLSLYVDGEGYCFVSVPQLADDTELSTQTMRSRLAWLEEVGAIARLSQWIDEYGRRNGDGRGKRTSDLIRLMIDDVEAIEASIEGGSTDVSREVSPMPQTGLNPEPETVSPTPALRQPYDSAEGLISEPDPESPLKAPQGAEREHAALEEPELFTAAWSAWPGHEVMRRDLALDEFRKLTAEQTTTPNFHLWIRNRGFEEFPAAATEQGAAVASTSYSVDSPQGLAIKALYHFARVPLFENRGFVSYPLEVTPQVLAFGSLPPEQVWHWIDLEGGRNQIAAWSHFLSAVIHKPRPELVRQRAQGEGRGMLVPWPWPPRKDGSISEDQQGAA